MGKTFLNDCRLLVLCKIALIAFLLFPAMNVLHAGMANAKTITGKVVSASDNEPLIGVSVQLLGTQRGTVTDLDGHYSIDANEGETLTFSYIGFVTQQIKVGAQNVINVTLNEDNQSLEDVVVIGYGVQKKKLVTGATTQMKGDDIAKLNTTSPLQAMQGQTPGVNIQSESGQPGSGMKVIIRGLGTIGNSGPLYLIDGVGGDISTVNPADIESIDVLKDAASAAIYGAQAANGVVLVTTKHGREGKPQISFDGYMGWQNVARKADMLNRHQYMEIMNEQSVNSGNGAIDWSKFKSITDEAGNYYDTDWMDAMFKTNAKTQSYNFGVNGGGKAATYALSLGYMSQEGVVGGKDVSNYERYNVRLNTDQKLASFLKIGEQIGMVYKKTHGIRVGNQYNNSLRGAFASVPLIPIYGHNAYDVPYYDTSDNDYWQEQGNPYGSMMLNNQNEDRSVNFTGNIFAELEPIQNLKFRTQLGTVYSTSEYRSFSPIYKLSPYDFQETKTSVSQSMGHGFAMTWTNTLSYNWNH